MAPRKPGASMAASRSILQAAVPDVLRFGVRTLVNIGDIPLSLPHHPPMGRTWMNASNRVRARPILDRACSPDLLKFLHHLRHS